MNWLNKKWGLVVGGWGLVLLNSCVLMHEQDAAGATRTKIAIGGEHTFNADGSSTHAQTESFRSATNAATLMVTGWQLLKAQESNNAVDIAGQQAATKQAGIKSREAVKINRQNVSLEKAKLEVVPVE